MNEIEQIIERTIRKLNVPEGLQEDARQEGWLAYCRGGSIIKHLREWLNKEVDYLRNEVPTDPLLLDKFAAGEVNSF